MDEDGFGVGGAEGGAGWGGAGLEEERGALRGGVHDVDGVEVEVFAVVVDGADEGGVGVGVCFGVCGYGGGGPGAFPEPVVLVESGQLCGNEIQGK